MTAETALIVTREALYMALLVSAVPVAVAMVVGLVISLLQAATQVQEQTLSSVPKIVAVAAVLLIGGPWMLAQLVQFSAALLRSIPDLVK